VVCLSDLLGDDCKNVGVTSQQRIKTFIFSNEPRNLQAPQTPFALGVPQLVFGVEAQSLPFISIKCR
jgi:hypothetical protein